MDDIDKKAQVEALQSEMRLREIEAQQPAKEVASKSIGRYGLFYITLIVLIGVVSSYFLPESAITAVMTMVGGALVALIGMLQGITGTAAKEEKPEYKLMNNMLERIGEKEPPMKVDVENGRVTVTKGHDTVTMNKE